MVKKSTVREPLPSSTNFITFNSIDLSVPVRQKRIIRQWINNAIISEKKLPGDIGFNFCSDKHILKINRKHLNHDFFTDIITFDLNEGRIISGDIYISIERVKDNAKNLKTLFHVELSRVLIHGVLHLCGYKDKTPSQQKEMRAKENYYLSLLDKAASSAL